MKSSGIGGQAVLEGIMMKSGDDYAVAVRKPDKEIEVDVKNYRGITKGKKFFKLPFIRGVFNFIDSMVLGIKSLTFSASFYDDEPQPKKKVGDKVTDKLFHEKAESIIMGVTVFISVIVSVALFIVLPFYVSQFFQDKLNILSKEIISEKTLTVLIEGLVRILIFVLYIFLISRMKDIQRTFMYHGAEHKCINCIEHGKELNVDNVMDSSRLHKRCGTSFMFLVMFISIVVFILMSLIFPFEQRWVKVLSRVLLVPVIASISYEIIRLAGRSNNIFVRIISAPGLLMQKLTTKEPTEDMVEVAICAVEAVFDWKQYLKDNDFEVTSEEDTILDDIEIIE